VLYGTGATTGEVFRLRIQDVDLSKGFIAFGGNRTIKPRRIPICPDLRGVLAHYLKATRPADEPSAYVFVEKGGGPIRARSALRQFKCLRLQVGISSNKGGHHEPTMRDLRATFAVHRLTSWIRSRADMNRMLPALSAYMGNSGLASAERFLSLTPERFRRHLNKLSPLRGKRHWRDDPDLMSFLANL